MKKQTTPLANLSKLLTPKKTADLLDTTEGTLSTWRSTGRIDLPFIKIGKNVRYKPEDVEDFISRHTQIQTI